ncbi:MAG TPA: TetR/AcrR family transcriptional regulator [Streptosporangiaceae bacterium]|nr:TetR/AcrR family transcriptional regulator [Streptosporangiaceae bacterium]
MGNADIPAAPNTAADAGHGPPKRGRPRSEQADRAILAAAADLLAERGLSGMSIEEVASRAGVGKATIYRRWTSRGTLALDAFLAEFQGQLPLPDTGSLHDDLLAALRNWIRSVTRTSAGPALAGLVAEAQLDPGLAAAWRERVFERLRAQQKIMLDRAVARGEISARTDYDVVLDLMFGAAYHRLLNGHRPLTDQFARRVVDLIMAGLRETDGPAA